MNQIKIFTDTNKDHLANMMNDFLEKVHTINRMEFSTVFVPDQGKISESMQYSVLLCYTLR